jgi:transcriptional regulator with XRE-family HTH domain
MEAVAELVDGRRLRTLRLERLMTQRELGFKARVSNETINRIENHPEPRPTAAITVHKLAAALGVEPSEIIAEQPDETR